MDFLKDVYVYTHVIISLCMFFSYKINQLFFVLVNKSIHSFYVFHQKIITFLDDSSF